MSLFDPASVRLAVAAFTPRRLQKFQDLSSAKEVIVELRQKRASYRAIADLLMQHCVPTSKTAIAAYCHEVLCEIIRAGGWTRVPVGSDGGAAGRESDGAGGTAAVPSRTRGPRIAHVRMLTPSAP